MFVLLQSFVAFIDCSCKARERVFTDEVQQSRSFKNLTGNALDAAIIDEISQQMKSNQRIQLRSFGISGITKNVLKNFSGIFSIDLRDNEIADIENESFHENSKLEKIDLMGNRLTKISKKMLSGDFEDLQEINLSFNLLASIESGAFDKLSYLESIDLSSNCLRHLHSDIFKKNAELREVDLSDNDIGKIESDLFNSKTDLKLLDLSKNKLDSIPKLLMKNIKHLDLSFNRITELDLNYDLEEKKKSVTIAELVLSNNQISECSELEERRTDVVHLDLSHNLIADLDDFPSFLNLEVLILANNNLTDLSLHNFEDRFPSLKVLNFRENPIACFDYRYVRNNLQSLVVSVDASIIHRCHHNSSAADSDEVGDYEDAIIREIRSKNHEIVYQLRMNRSMLVILLSAFAVCAIGFSLFVMKYRIKLTKRSKNNLIDQMEL